MTQTLKQRNKRTCKLGSTTQKTVWSRLDLLSRKEGARKLKILSLTFEEIHSLDHYELRITSCWPPNNKQCNCWVADSNFLGYCIRAPQYQKSPIFQSQMDYYIRATNDNEHTPSCRKTPLNNKHWSRSLQFDHLKTVQLLTPVLSVVTDLFQFRKVGLFH